MAELISYLSIANYLPAPPEQKPGMSDVNLQFGISGLSFDFLLLSCLLFFYLVRVVLFLFQPYFFLLMVHSGIQAFSRKFSNSFHQEIGFLYGSC